MNKEGAFLVPSLFSKTLLDFNRTRLQTFSSQTRILPGETLDLRGHLGTSGEKRRARPLARPGSQVLPVLMLRLAYWSGRKDSNLRPSAPKAFLASLLTSFLTLVRWIKSAALVAS